MDKNRRRIRIGYIQWLLIYTYICTIFSFTCEAANAQDRTGNEEYVLILNSFMGYRTYYCLRGRPLCVS